jgi:arylsulfatase A-like enzyme
MNAIISPLLKSSTVAGTILTGLSLGGGTCAIAQTNPNIIIIFADDMGYGDPGCYNTASKIPTPHMDAMAKRGRLFTDAHTSSAVCTPSRYSLLTGRYNWRSRLKSGVFDGFSPPLIDAGQPTIAIYLKKAGYTTACIGKWHLGMQWTRKDGSPESVDREKGGFRAGENIDFTKPIAGGPLAVGFDSYFGISGSLDMPPYCWIENDRSLNVGTATTGGSKDMFLSHTAGVIADGFKPEDVLPTLKRKTVEWLDNHLTKNKDTPFFLYLPLNSPHLPIVTNKEYMGKSQAGLYGDYVVETDDTVGAVIDALRRNGALENTLVIVTSDNGGLWFAREPIDADDRAFYKPTPRGEHLAGFGHRTNGGFRGGKADIWDGGHRVPFLVQWPARIPAGVIKTPVEVTDVFATIAEIIGKPLEDMEAPDSFSFWPAMKDSNVTKTGRPFLVHHSVNGDFSIREGDWKYMDIRGSGGFTRLAKIKPKPGEPTGQLYNMKNDNRESINRFQNEPQKAAYFAKLMEKIKNSESLRLDVRAGKYDTNLSVVQN